ncbi:MAG: translation elongation factor Ts [Planctomycetaceae bacterium]
MEIDAKIVAELRRRTGLPMMKCKQALVESKGDLEGAEDHLRKLGLKTVDKVKDRTLKEGLAFVASDAGGKAAVALRCETDFVARSADFVAFGKALAAALLAKAPKDAGAGADLTGFSLPDGGNVAERLQGLIAKLGENLAVGEFARFRSGEGLVASYVHHNEKVATLVELAGKGLKGSDEVSTLGTELCMHIAFHREAQALRREDLDAAWVAKEREIFLAQAQEMPENKRAAIAEGKLSKRLKEVVLLEQPFIKDEKRSVKEQVDAVGKQIGAPLEIRRFARISAGA